MLLGLALGAGIAAKWIVLAAFGSIGFFLVAGIAWRWWRTRELKLPGDVPLAHLPAGVRAGVRDHPGRRLHRILVSVLRARTAQVAGRPDHLQRGGVPLPRDPESHPSVWLAVVVVAAALAAGPLLRRVHKPRHRPVLGSAPVRARVQPGQSLDLVDEHPLRAVAAVLHHPAPQLSRRRDPGRVHHAVPAVVRRSRACCSCTR